MAGNREASGFVNSAVMNTLDLILETPETHPYLQQPCWDTVVLMNGPKIPFYLRLHKQYIKHHTVQCGRLSERLSIRLSVGHTHTERSVDQQ